MASTSNCRKLQKIRADSRTHKFVAADGSRRTFPQLLRSAPTPVGGYDFLNSPRQKSSHGSWEVSKGLLRRHVPDQKFQDHAHRIAQPAHGGFAVANSRTGTCAIHPTTLGRCLKGLSNPAQRWRGVPSAGLVRALPQPEELVGAPDGQRHRVVGHARHQVPRAADKVDCGFEHISGCAGWPAQFY